MKIRKTGQDAGQASGSFAASRRPRILKPQDCLMLSKICQDKEGPPPFVAGCGRWTESFQAANWGCVQSTHFGLRIGSYRCRTGPDSLCFRESPLFAGERMQFESHLGHAFPLVGGGFCFNVCTKLVVASSDGWCAVCGLAAAVAYSGVWVAGSGPWLLGPPPALCWDYGVSGSGSIGLVVDAFTPVHGSW
jgi:hypothetical protein